MKLTVNVTQCDIDLGCVGDGNRCPIAQALIRALTERGFGWVMVAVGTTVFRIQAVGQRMADIPTPVVATTFIVRFDQTHTVNPFTFELEIPWADPNPGIPVPADMRAVAIKETVCKSK